MQPDHPTTNPESTSEGGPVAVPTTDAATAGTTLRTSLWLWALAGGLVAGLVSWLGGEATYGYFQPAIVYPPDWKQMNPYAQSDYLANEHRRKIPPAELKNTALAYGMLGATLGGALGLAGGLARRSARAGLVAALIGVAVGGGAGALVSAVAVPLFFRFLDPEWGSLLVPLLAHVAIFTVVGAAGGALLGLGLGDRISVLRGLLGGVIGGVIGTILFEVIVAVAFPTMRLDVPIPVERTPRLLVHLCVAVLVALCATLEVSRRSRRPIGQPHPA